MDSSKDKQAISSALLEASKQKNFFCKTIVDQYPEDFMIIENTHYNHGDRRIDKAVYHDLLTSGFLEIAVNEHGTRGFSVSDKG